MSDVKPQIRCDRCGRVEFKEKSPDSDFMARPRGWGSCEHKDLCDRCYGEFSILFNGFMGRQSE